MKRSKKNGTHVSTITNILRENINANIQEEACKVQIVKSASSNSKALQSTINVVLALMNELLNNRKRVILIGKMIDKGYGMGMGIGNLRRALESSQ